MRPAYLLDTNIASVAMRRHEGVLRRLAQVDVGFLAVSAVTEAELRFGLALLPNSTRLSRMVEEFLSQVAIVPWGSLAARQYALLRAWLHKQGRPMGNLNLMIAAQALALGATLVTNDRAFARITNLKIEDWSLPED